MSRILLSLTLALLVAMGSACAKSPSQRGNSRPRKTVEDRFAEMDVNKDGKLSLQEFRGHATQADHIAILDNEFKAADANHDGFLSLDEYKAYVEKSRSGRWGRRGR
jgi:Ca2+-binding EF-hand superfamily protein